MDRFAVLVDAGYLLSQGAQILSNRESRRRKDIAIRDPQGLITMIVKQAIDALGNPRLLRVYWYDGVSGKLSNEQVALSQLPDVQLRQGIISQSGVQKGVDSKIMADLIELSSNHAIADAMLVTGDGDLVIGIELAQKRGVRVAVMGLEDSSAGVNHNQSFEVVCTADRVVRIHKPDIDPFLTYLPVMSADTGIAASAVVSQTGVKAPAKKKAASATKKAATKATPATAPVPTPVDLHEVAAKFIDSSSPPLTRAAVSPTGTIAQSIDGQLLQAATAVTGRTLTPSERTELRDHFRALIAKSDRATSPPPA